MSTSDTKSPRLFVPAALGAGDTVPLEQDKAHYLLNVMRLKSGDAVRLFNGRDGEWLARLEQTGKKTAHLACGQQLRVQPAATSAVHLLFAPIKRDRMEVLIEKAVELGATDLHPVLTQRCEVRKLNDERLAALVAEAAEQCERLDMPVLHPLGPLDKKIVSLKLPVYAALERRSAPLFVPPQGDVACLVGPEGGFTEQEMAMLENAAHVSAVNLGSHILRAETAAIAMLSAVIFQR